MTKKEGASWVEKGIEGGLKAGWFKETVGDNYNSYRMTEKGTAAIKRGLKKKQSMRLYLESLSYNHLKDYYDSLPADEKQMLLILEKAIILETKLREDGCSFLEMIQDMRKEGVIS